MAIAVAVLPPQVAAQMNTTTVQGTVYRADGTPASGTLLVNWPAFTTPQNQSVAAGNLSTTIGADGFVSLNLTPNASALPGGSYYTAVYHLSDGTVNQEYWVVPSTATATIAAVRAQLEPSTVAIQSVSQAYVQSAISSLSGSWLSLTGGAMTGPLTLNADPTAQSQAATKHYADQLAAAQLPLSGGTLTGPLTAPNIYAKQFEGHLYADQWQSGAGNNGIAMSLAQCAALPYACQVIAPETYAMTEHPPANFGSASTLPGTCFTDYRVGGPQVSCTPAPSNAWEWGNDNRHSLSSSFTTINNWALAGLSNHPAPGLSVGMTNVYGTYNFTNGQSNAVGEILNNTSFASASMNNLLAQLYALGNGDHIGILDWVQSYGGISAGDNEGNEDKSVHTEGPDVFEGTISSISTSPSSSKVCTAPCTIFNTTKTQGIYGNALGDGLELIDITQGDSTGYISSAWNPVTANGSDWDTKYGLSNAHTTLTAAIAQGSSTNVFPETDLTISVVSGVGFVTGKPACIFDTDGQNWECDNVTAVGTNTLTLGVVNAPFTNGSVVSQGGMAGMGFTMQADWISPGDTGGIAISDAGLWNTIRPTYPIEYNSAGATATLFSGSRGGYSWSSTRAYTTMGSGGTASATVSGGVVTSCAVSGGSGYSSGSGGPGGGVPQLVPTVNAGATAPVLAVGWISGSGLVNCTVISGGSGITTISVAVVPQNAYAVYPMAHLLNVWNPATGQVDGSSLATDTPAGTFAVGDTVEAPHYFATAYTGSNQHVFDYQPGSAGIDGRILLLGGAIMGNHYADWITNTNSMLLYQGLPGLYDPNPNAPGMGRWSTPYGYTLQGAFRDGLFMKNPPFGGNGGSLMGAVVVSCGGACSNWNQTYSMLTAQNPNNSSSAEDILGYNPSTMTWTQSAGAAGVAGTNPYCTETLAGTSSGGFSVTCNGHTSRLDTGGDLSLPGFLQAQGGITGATINGEFAVDGMTYKTVNAAWNAAVSLANTSGQNQTVRLGPGTFPVTATLTEPSNGACVSVLGSAGTTVNADRTQIATTLTVPASLGGDVFYLGNAVQAQGCTFRDLNLLAGGNATHGFELQWFRGVLIDNVTVNDTTAEGILLGDENTSAGHQANFLLRNVTVSYSSAAFTPANRSAYGVHLQKTAIDSHLDNVIVRNALTAAVYNEGTGNTGYLIHGFGYPYTCTTAPCANNASSSSASNASWATSYVIYDTGGSGSVWADTYADSPAVAGFYVGADGVEIHGGHIQWPDLTSFPAANLAYVAANVTNNLLIGDVDCLEMASGVNWITYAGTAGNPPTYAGVHHLTGCGNYYQALEPANQTGFSSGGANINDPSGATPRVWSTPVSSAASYPAYSAQMYSGDQGDAFQAHFSGVNPFFNITYQGTIRSNGGIALGTIINTASTLTLTAANKNVIANAAGGAQTITLPSCYTPLPDRASPTGLEFTVVKSDPSANTVTLQTTNSQLIYSQGTSATTLVLSSPSTQTLVCGPDYNWYVAGTAGTGSGSFSQLSGQVSNSQLPTTLTAGTTGNASTATALAATPTQCPTGYYSTGIAANGTANCVQSWHFTWFGYFGGTFGTATNTSLGSIWSPSAAINVTRLDIAVGTPPSGCTAYPVIGIYDSTSSTWLKTVTLAAGTYSYRNAVTGVSIVAGHNLSMGVQTAGSGCTYPQNAQLTMEYTMNQ
jgi:hypothetical protein